MNWKQLFAALLAGSVLAISGSAVQAEDKDKDKAEELKSKGTAVTNPTVVDPCAPQYTTVWVTECVPETYTAKRIVMKPVTVAEQYTAYRTECVAEQYTAYRTECVAEVRHQQVTVNKIVCEQVTQMQTVWTCVPTVEQRTVCKPVCVTKQVTHMECRKKDMGHYECREEVVSPGFFAKMKHKCGGGCGCEDSCEPCPKVRTKKVWVSCWVTEQVPVTKCVKTTEYVHEVCNVTVMKKVCTQQPCTVTVRKCVPTVETRTCTVMVPKTVAYPATRMVSKCVAYPATRTVTRCVPTEETYTATRMVSHQVAKQVPVAPAAPCGCECEHGRKHWSFGGFGGMFRHKSKGCGCESGCGCN